jgi:hypothetical protein
MDWCLDHPMTGFGPRERLPRELGFTKSVSFKSNVWSDPACGLLRFAGIYPSSESDRQICIKSLFFWLNCWHENCLEKWPDVNTPHVPAAFNKAIYLHYKTKEKWSECLNDMPQKSKYGRSRPRCNISLDRGVLRMGAIDAVTADGEREHRR